MESISQSEFDGLIHEAQILEADRRGPKVYETPDGQMVKLFRVKRLLSSNLLCPYAVRFARNADGLKALGVPSVEVSRVARVPHLDRQMVVYAKLPGQPLRHALRDASSDDSRSLIDRFGGFFARMHGLGVFFRSFHFGNVLIGPQGEFSLIDMLDLQLKGRPLGISERERNFRHIIRYAEDRQRLTEHWAGFQEGYRVAAASDNPARSEAIRALLDRQFRQLRASTTLDTTSG
jgi:hypothetical protein